MHLAPLPAAGGVATGLYAEVCRRLFWLSLPGPQSSCTDGPTPTQIPSHITGHDGAGLGAGWHLARVIVENLATGESVTFECNRWFDKSEDDGAIERELLASQSIVGGTNWKLTVVTGGATDDVMWEWGSEGMGSEGHAGKRGARGAKIMGWN